MADNQRTQREDAALIARAERAVAELRRQGQRVSFPAVAALVGVARSTLYRNASIRRMVADAKGNWAAGEAEWAAMRDELRDIRSVLKEVKSGVDQLIRRRRGKG